MRRISGPIALSLAGSFSLVLPLAPGLTSAASAAEAPVAPWPCVANAAATVHYADLSRVEGNDTGFLVAEGRRLTLYGASGERITAYTAAEDIIQLDSLLDGSVLLGEQVYFTYDGRRERVGGQFDLVEVDAASGTAIDRGNLGFSYSVGRSRFVTRATAASAFGGVLGGGEFEFGLIRAGQTMNPHPGTNAGIVRAKYGFANQDPDVYLYARQGTLHVPVGYFDGYTDHRDLYLHNASTLKLYDGTNLNLIGSIDISSTGGTVVSYQYSGGVGRLLTSNGKLWDAVPGSGPVLLATDLPLIGATLMADEAGNMFLNEGHPDNLITPLQGVEAIDMPSNRALADQVERLYRAYFLRDPDSGGFAHWRSRRAAGQSIESISSVFASSQEFQNRYGSLTNSEFVTLVYDNVLHRAPEADGLAFWTGRLDAGASRGEVMVGFSESTEYVASTGTVAPNSSETGGVFRLYWAFLERDPDLAGLCFWARRLETGTTLQDVADSFASSVEFINKYGQLSNSEFVNLVYQNVLGRPADPDGLAFWTGRLNAGASRGEVMVGFSESTENVLRRGVLP